MLLSSEQRHSAAADDSALRQFFSRVLRHIDNAALSAALRLNMLQSAEDQLNK
ncbi:unnamed protein product [Plutella xylostella]|uniref:(diamondback moth) hypothetical protein n=1 Tax=Plutella xylostella TaxID=51655 RepID=A0A8S4DY51_PLUXY|nr:unnamed protein product [Plutella xylostella]